jgi:hypothetical protein
MAAPCLQQDGEFDRSTSSQPAAQVQQTMEKLLSGEPLDMIRSKDSADLVSLLHEAVALVSPPAGPNGVQFELLAPEQVFVDGPAEDLLDTLSLLLEQASACGKGPIQVRLWVEADGNSPACATTELFNQSFDVPDHFRRRLSKAVFARGGEAYFVTEAVGFRVKIRIPIVYSKPH